MKRITSMYVTRRLRKAIAAGLLCASAPAFAWGPATQEAVVSAASHIFSRDNSIPLTNLVRYVHQGARMDREMQRTLYPGYDVDPIQVIQREMFLLQGVKSERVDPYFAYRLGGLGKLVVQHVAPMRDANPAIREQYYADVDRVIGRVPLQGGRRNLVDPGAYFPQMDRTAQDNNGTIVVDYNSGLGFNGLAKASLPNDVSRAIDSVADVWFTIFQSNVELIDVSRSDMRDYMLESIEFYLKSGNIEEVNDVYTRAGDKNLLDEEMKQRVGNYYYDNGYFEEALAVYDELLITNPRIPAVNRRISNYHVSLGKQALNRNNLESAQSSFQDAVNADKLNEEAQRQLVTTTRDIEKRDGRFAQQQGLIEAAERAEMEAAAADQRDDPVLAIANLRDAEEAFDRVTTEFEDLNRSAVLGLRRIEGKMVQMKEDLIDNAQILSGSGFAYDARLLAGTSGNIIESTLRSMLEADYRAAIDSTADSVTVD